MRIKKEDTVKVISGAHKGKVGKVLKVFPARNRVIVEGVNLIKRHTRPNPTYPQGGIIEKEGTIHISNVMLFRNEETWRIGSDRLKDGSKVRVVVKAQQREMLND